MEPVSPSQETSPFTQYLRTLRRHKWPALAVALLLPAAALAFSLAQSKRYEASADVLVNRENVAANLAGAPNAVSTTAPAATEAEVARVPAIAKRVLAATGSRESVAAFLRASSVTTQLNSDVITFKVQDANAGRAARLATEYARQFTRYRSELDTAAVRRALAEVQTQLATVSRNRRMRSVYRALLTRQQQLRTALALQSSKATLIRRADNAEQIQPRPLRNTALGLILGVVLGLGLAFVLDALDNRVHRADEIARRLRRPLLARVPAPPRELGARNQLAMLADPGGMHAEAYRMLRINVEFMNLDRGAKTIMVTSAVEEEGKSTTVANLAVAFARTGWRVVLVDLDVRRPFLHVFFGLGRDPGAADVALGHTDLASALKPFDLNGAVPRAAERDGAAATRVPELPLEILPAGISPPDAGEFVASDALARVLADVADRADLVLIDAPPLLRVGDPLALARNVDAVLVVTRLDAIDRSTLDELVRVLESLPTEKLGFIATGAERDEGFAYASSDRT